MNRFERWKNSIQRNIVIVVGTRAQLIKMIPVIREFERIGMNFKLLFTGQHKVTMEDLMAESGVKSKAEYLYHGREVSGLVRMMFWAPMMIARILARRKELYDNSINEKSLILVHGDTFSTLIGALTAKLAGHPVAHIESGLRSYNIFNPFPEELTRLVVFRLSDAAFCPGSWASSNMKKYKVRIFDTKQNTLIDSLKLATDQNRKKIQIKSKSYCVVSVHRFENIFFRKRLEWIVSAVEGLSEKLDVIIVMHPTTERRLRKNGLYKQLNANNSIQLLHRMTYFPFIDLIQGAQFVITDGGSNQEELSYLRKPTLLLRNATERKEGLGENAALCPFQKSVFDNFVDSASQTSPSNTPLSTTESPSRIIAKCLTE